MIEAGRFGRDGAGCVSDYDQLDPRIGVTRPECSPANRELRDYTVARMQAAGLRVTWDRMGNIYGRKEGTKASLGAIMTGSHLDSVVNGGMFDGALGVFMALEAVNRLGAEGFENERPIEVVAFTGEEGSAFKPTLLGSLVLTGELAVDVALERRDDGGRTLAEALDAIGYLGSDSRDLSDVEYYLEPHIEQGPVLDLSGATVGIVENIAGVIWLDITIIGEENHAGSTPMRLRKDALVAAADMVSLVNRKARDLAAASGGTTVGTVGKLAVFPGGINQIPGRVELSVDIRDVKMANMESLSQAIMDYADEITRVHGVRFEFAEPSVHEPQQLSGEVTAVIERAAREIGVTSQRMNSGAVHDAQNMARRVKSGMLFVPSVRGISHAPLEWTNWEDIENGARVLTGTLKMLSRFSV